MKNQTQKSQLNQIKSMLRGIYDIALVTFGFILFTLFKKRHIASSLGMIRLFCRTGGYSNDAASSLISLTNKPYRIKNVQSVLGELSEDSISNIVKYLKKDGYYVFENRLPTSFCNKLLNNALERECLTFPMDGQENTKAKRIIYNRMSPIATKYSFHIQDLIDWPEIQNLISDPIFLAISQQYLNSKVYFDQSMLWWSTAYSAKPDGEAAQMFHFDMDRFKWLKFFIYLTDVTIESGPHTFVAGSHRTNGIPRELLRKGYTRLTDEEVEKFYSSDRIIQFTGPVGTIIVEDTRGLHKGAHLMKGDRLILEIQYSNNLFGAPLEIGKFKTFTNQLRQSIAQYPKTYSFYL